jgi:hypothetical protein
MPSERTAADSRKVVCPWISVWVRSPFGYVVKAMSRNVLAARRASVNASASLLEAARALAINGQPGAPGLLVGDVMRIFR